MKTYSVITAIKIVKALLFLSLAECKTMVDTLVVFVPSESCQGSTLDFIKIVRADDLINAIIKHPKFGKLLESDINYKKKSISPSTASKRTHCGR